MRGTSGKRSAMHGQADIFRAEIVPPLRHAMRLVDRKQRDLGLAEQGKAARRQQSFRRDIEQVEIAGQQPPLDFGGLVERQRRVQHRRVDAGLEQPRDLVAHQRDQRRDHDAAAFAQQATAIDSTATCRRRSASAPGSCRLPSRAGRSFPARRERPAGRIPNSAPTSASGVSSRWRVAGADITDSSPRYPTPRVRAASRWRIGGRRCRRSNSAASRNRPSPRPCGPRD